jgi:choline dehydrogenase
MLHNHFSLFLLVVQAIFIANADSAQVHFDDTEQTPLPACPDTVKADYDYVVIGAGVGGGPLAARLAEAGFSGTLFLPPPRPPIALTPTTVLVVDAGHDVQNVNTTVPIFFGRALDG